MEEREEVTRLNGDKSGEKGDRKGIVQRLRKAKRERASMEMRKSVRERQWRERDGEGLGQRCRASRAEVEEGKENLGKYEDEVEYRGKIEVGKEDDGRHWRKAERNFRQGRQGRRGRKRDPEEV